MEHPVRCARRSLTQGPNLRRGSVLVEFAMVSFALYILMVVFLDLGRASLATQTIQSAADVIAAELARAPLPATLNFEGALGHPRITAEIFDEEALVVVLGPGLETSQGLDDYFATLPIVNQMLRPVMINDELDTGELVLRYPGALVRKTSTGRPTVLIPRVDSREWDGQEEGGYETIRWSHVIEEVLAPGAPSHFPINSGGALAGFVNVRVNYPYQAAAMSGFHEDPQFWGPKHVIMANDERVGGDVSPDGYTLVGTPGNSTASPYSGRFGLGHHYAFGERVRPYRKLISVQSAARREVITQNSNP